VAKFAIRSPIFMAATLGSASDVVLGSVCQTQFLEPRTVLPVVVRRNARRHIWMLIVGVILRMPTGFAILGITFGLVYLSGSGVEALPRYFSVVFPIYIAAALIVKRWPVAGTPLLALSVALQAVSVILLSTATGLREQRHVARAEEQPAA